MALPGFPIRKSADMSRMCRSPQLIAACHVLRRLLMPRHPPCALISLIYFRIMQAFYTEFLEIAFTLFSLFHNCFSVALLCLLARKKAFNTFVFVQFSRCSLLSPAGQVGGWEMWSALRASFPFFSHLAADSRGKPMFNALINCQSVLTLYPPPSAVAWWAQVDSNHRPHDYQSCALTS